MAGLEARRTSFLIQEKRYIKKDGKVIVGRVIVNAIRNSKGEAVLFIAELEDITERKRSEEELRRAEEKFRTIFDGATDGILVADLKTRRFAYANPRICEITCYSLEELLKLGIDDIHPKKDLLYVIDQFTKQTQGKTTFAKDIPVLRKDEKVVYCDINSKPIRIEGQEYLVGFFRDITERKKAEEALRESEQRWATTLASIGDAVIATNLSGMVTFMNCVAEELTGWALSEALGKPVKEVFRIVNEQTRIEVEDPVSKVLERGLIAGLANHTVLIRKNGTEVAIDDSGAPIKDKEDKITGVVLVFHDITEARKVQDALMKSETQYRQLINVAQEGVWVLDSNYCTVFVNPRMAEMLGYAENEIVGKSIFEFLDKKDIEQAKQFFGQSKQGITTYFDYEFTRKNGSRIYASISTSVINDDEGNTLGTLAMVSDITYRKTLE
jgi:PAS domain S-box-containing protein